MFEEIEEKENMLVFVENDFTQQLVIKMSMLVSIIY